MGKIFRKIIYFLIKFKQYKIIIFIYVLFVRRLLLNKKNKNIFVLSNEEFRKEFHILRNKFNFFISPSAIHAIFFDYFFNCKRDYMLPEFYNINKRRNRDLYIQKEKFQKFLLEIFPQILNRLNIKTLILPHFRYLNNIYITDVLMSLDIKIICIFKESLSLVSKKTFNLVKERYISYKKIRVDKLIVFNQKTKDMFEKTNSVPKSKIEVLGSLRMYNLLNNFKRVKSEKPNILLLSFDQKTSFYGRSVDKNYDQNFGRELFFDVHGSFIRLAKKYPNLNFIIRPKIKFTRKGSNWINLLQELFERKNFNHKLYPNLIIDDIENFHDRLKNISICCGIQSTALLEASVTGMPVILVLFKRFTRSNFFHEFSLRNKLDLFESVYSENELEKCILKNTKNFCVKESIIKKRKKLFSYEVSKISENMVQSYHRLFNNL